MFELVRKLVGELVSMGQIKIIRAKYKYAELNSENQMREVTEPYYDEIAALSEEKLMALTGVQGSPREKDDPYSDIIHQVYKSLKTVTTRDIILYRGDSKSNGFDRPNRIIYSTSMELTEAFYFAHKKYLHMSCIYVPRGSVIISSAAVLAGNKKRSYEKDTIDDKIRQDAYSGDLEREIILDSTYVNKLGPHLWGVIPKTRW